MTLLVGIAGLIGSGKDTAAEALVENGFAPFAFGDKVREAALVLNPLLRVCREAEVSVFRLSDLVIDYGWEEAKRKFPSVRECLQTVGTDMGRKVIGENCWIDALRPLIWQCTNPNIVIKDVRHHNEVSFIHDEGGFVVRIVRPGVVKDAHESESFIDDLKVDFEINNNGTVDELKSKVLLLFRS